MKQTLILLAGYPGTGKSYLANKIMEMYSTIHLCSPDEIKEAYWDAYGFDTQEEKALLIQKSWETYYQQLEVLFQNGHSVISDYPFSDKQKMELQSRTEHLHIQVMTIRLVGNIPILFERQKKRDLDSRRHLGHILTSYHKNVVVDHALADNLLDYEEFYKRCTTRGYGEFSLGKTIEVDVSDFTKVNYTCILESIKDYSR